MARLNRASKSVAVLLLAMLCAQVVGGAALAAWAAPPTDTAGAPVAPTLSERVVEPPVAAKPTLLNAPGEALTADEAIARVAFGDGSTTTGHPAPPDPSSLSTSGDRVPLADTDENDPAKARWINSTDTQFVGESVNGANAGSGRHTDIDWWRFHLGYSPSSADTISFDITKDTWDHMAVIVYAWPDADPEGNSQVVGYEYMNKTQGLGNPSTFSFTAFEQMDYIMLIQQLFVRNGCCQINYSITNIQFSTAVPEDDNNNLTRSEVLVPSALPTNREVDQAADLYDVFDLTSLFTIDKTRGDDAQVQLGVQVSAGRTGFTDFYNSSSGAASPDTVVSVGYFDILFQDRYSNWWTLGEVALTPGNSGTVQGLVNGTPAFAVVHPRAFGAGSGVTSSIPGWVRYNFTSWAIQEDHAPVKVADIPTVSIYEDSPASGQDLVDLSQYFTDDIDAGALFFQVTYPPASNPFIAPTINGNMLSVAPKEANWSGNAQVQVDAHDLGWDRVQSPDDHITKSNFFTVQVLPVNDPPRILSYGGITVTGAPLSFSVAQGQTLTLTALATDPEDNNSLTWSLTPTPPNATFNTATGALTLNPSNDDVGNYTVVLGVRDPSQAWYNLTLNLHVTNVNDPPRFTTVGGVAVGGSLSFDAAQGDPFSLTLQIDDPDWDIGVPNTFRWFSDQAFISVTPDGADPTKATASFTPTNDQVGVITATFSVGDGPAGVFSDNVTVTITVANKNDPPVFTHIGTIFGTYPLTSKTYSFLGNDGAIQGKDFGFTVRASDIDVERGLGDSLTFETNMPGRVQVTPKAGGLSADLLFVPTQEDASAGQVQVLVYVNDSLAPTMGDMITVIIDVANVNDPPVLEPVTSLELTQDVPFSYTFQATDPDGDAVTFSSDSPLFPVDSTTGSIDFTPTNLDIQGADKVFEVTITARDSSGGVATMRVTVVIKNVNDPPSGAEIQNPISGQTFKPDETITLTGTATDVDKDQTGTLTYKWFLDDVSVGEGKTVTATLTNDGESSKLVVVRMQVTDTGGASVNQTVSVTVEGKQPSTPGFEGPAAVLALAGVAGVAAAVAAGRRRRR